MHMQYTCTCTCVPCPSLVHATKSAMAAMKRMMLCLLAHMSAMAVGEAAGEVHEVGSVAALVDAVDDAAIDTIVLRAAAVGR